MNFVHKCVYNRSLEFEEEEEKKNNNSVSQLMHSLMKLEKCCLIQQIGQEMRLHDFEDVQ